MTYTEIWLDEVKENRETFRVIQTALDDLAFEVFLAKVPCEVCGLCADTLSPCFDCKVLGHYGI